MFLGFMVLEVIAMSVEDVTNDLLAMDVHVECAKRFDDDVNEDNLFRRIILF